MAARRARWSSPQLLLLSGVTFILSVASALVVVRLAPVVTDTTFLFLLGLALLVAVKRGMLVLGAAIGLPLTGLNPVLFSIGTAELRGSDVLLFGALLVLIIWGQGQSLSYRILAPLGVLCLVTAGSALLVSRDSTALLSALRFTATMSLAFFIVWLCRERADIVFVLRAAAVAIVVGIALSFASGGGIDERLGQGLLGPNILGLASAFLILLGMTRVVSINRVIRVALVLTGVGGLFLAKSVGAIVALGFSLALLFGLRSKHLRAGRVLVGLAVILGVAVALVASFRPTSLPWHAEFGLNSGQHRLITAYAGIRVFLQEPLTGVGWARSSEAISDPEIASVVRDTIASGNPLLYPDIEAAGVHNAYLQVLAELGLVGLVLLVWLISGSVRAGADLLRAGHPLAPFVCASLMLFGIWWNETGLFGGQPETFLFAMILGIGAVGHFQVRLSRSLETGPTSVEVAEESEP